MINDLKLGFKLFKYGIQSKSLITLFFIFTAIGILMELFATSTMDNMGGLYMVLCPIYFAQLLITSTVSLYIASSPYKFKLQTIIPVTYNFIIMTITFGLFIILRLLRIYLLSAHSEELIKNALCGIIFVAFFVMVLQIYSVIAYRSFIASLFVFFPVFIITFAGQGFISKHLGRFAIFGKLYNLSAVSAVSIAIVMLVLGYVGSYYLSIALYRKDLDPRTYKQALARVGR